MINAVARHKLSKLRNSKMLLIFGIVAAFIALVTIVPMLIFASMAGSSVSGPEALASYFQLISFIGHTAAVVIGAVCWRQDLRDGTILTFAARPLSRFTLFFGKVLGCLYAVLLYFVVALVLFALLDGIFFSYLPPVGFYIYLLQQLLSIILTFAVVLFFSNFFNPVMAVVLAIVYFLIGGIGTTLITLTTGFWHGLGLAIRAIAIERDLSYSPTALLTADLATLKPVWEAIGYYLVWLVALISASALLFNRRELLTKRS